MSTTSWSPATDEAAATDRKLLRFSESFPPSNKERRVLLLFDELLLLPVLLDRYCLFALTVIVATIGCACCFYLCELRNCIALRTKHQCTKHSIAHLVSRAKRKRQTRFRCCGGQMAGCLSAICKTPHTTNSWKVGKPVLISPNCHNSGLGSAFSHMIQRSCSAIAGITTDTRTSWLLRARKPPEGFQKGSKGLQPLWQ